MKKNNILWLLLLALCSIFAACKKDHPPKTELEKLPPATQTGANTFGCLLNGQVWIPKDNYGQATFKLDVDPTFQNGAFGVRAIRYYSGQNFQSVSFGSDSCKTSGGYSFTVNRNRAGYADYGIPLVLSSGDLGVICIGNFTITRYDVQNRIFSGTFEFTLSKGTDTIKITQGRFDKKL